MSRTVFPSVKRVEIETQIPSRSRIVCVTGPPGIHLSASQYGVLDCIVDLLIFDVTKNPWRIGGMFDASVPSSLPLPFLLSSERLLPSFDLFQHRNRPPLWRPRRS